MSPLRTELLRKAVHIGMGGGAFLLRWLTPLQAVGVALLAVLFNLFLLHRITGRSLLRDGERERGFSLGIAVYPMAVMSLILVFHQRLELAAACWVLLAFGDGMATVVGLLLRGPRLPWNPAKSWSGLVAFVIYGGLGAAVVIRWTQAAILTGGAAAAEGIGRSFVATTSAESAIDETLWLLLACGGCAAIVGFVESLDTGIDDNVLVALFGGATFALATLVEPVLLVNGSADLARQLTVGLLVNIPLAAVALAVRGVGRSGAIAGCVIGALLWGFAGWQAWMLLLIFFVIGTASTRLGYARKARLGIAQERGGRRGARNAIANSATAVICAFMAFSSSHPEVYLVALAAAFGTAIFDTVSSELGQAYGRRHFLVTTFRRVKAGTDGAVSVEGTLAGVLAAVMLGVAGWAGGWYGAAGCGVVVAGAFIGTTFESYLGATLERVQKIDNELVNFSNTVVGAVAAGLLLNLLPNGI